MIWINLYSFLNVFLFAVAFYILCKYSKKIGIKLHYKKKILPELFHLIFGAYLLAPSFIWCFSYNSNMFFLKIVLGYIAGIIFCLLNIFIYRLIEKHTPDELREEVPDEIKRKPLFKILNTILFFIASILLMIQILKPGWLTDY